MPTLDAEEPLPPAFPPWLMVLSLASAGAFVYLAFHRMRELPAWGMEGATLQNATIVAMGAFLGCMATGAWIARRRRKAGRLT